MPEKSTEKQQRLVPIKELPIYAEPPKLTDFRFVEDDPVIGTHFFRRIRLAGRDYCDAIKARLGIVNKSLEPVKEAAVVTEDYFRRERDFLPKAAAITLGGMAGFVAGMRRKGHIRRWVYATGGLLAMAAFCYPNETIQTIRIGVAHAQRTWEDFQKSPEPQKKKSSSSP